jgi:hypothetical protein
MTTVKRTTEVLTKPGRVMIFQPASGVYITVNTVEVNELVADLLIAERSHDAQQHPGQGRLFDPDNPPMKETP